jgi:hypothetical protein
MMVGMINRLQEDHFRLIRMHGLPILACVSAIGLRAYHLPAKC